MSQLLTKLFFLLHLCIVASTVQAQFAERIRTGRPGQSNGPFALGNAVFQLQAGLDYYNDQLTSTKLKENVERFSQNTSLRYGLTETFEIRANYGLDLYQKSSMSEVADQNTKLRNMGVGIRKFISNQKGVLPGIGLQLTLASSAFQEKLTNNFSTELKLILGHRISSSLNLNTNLAYQKFWESEEEVYPYVISLG